MKGWNLAQEADCVSVSPLSSGEGHEAVQKLDHATVDRADLGSCVKHLARRMQQPREVDMQRLKRLDRYLKKGKPHVVQRFETRSSRDGQGVKTTVDSDNAGELNTRSSTVGQGASVGRVQNGSMSDGSSIQGDSIKHRALTLVQLEQRGGSCCGGCLLDCDF